MLLILLFIFGADRSRIMNGVREDSLFATSGFDTVSLEFEGCVNNPLTCPRRHENLFIDIVSPDVNPPPIKNPGVPSSSQTNSPGVSSNGMTEEDLGSYTSSASRSNHSSQRPSTSTPPLLTDLTNEPISQSDATLNLDAIRPQENCERTDQTPKLAEFINKAKENYKKFRDHALAQLELIKVEIKKANENLSNKTITEDEYRLRIAGLKEWQEKEEIRIRFLQEYLDKSALPEDLYYDSIEIMDQQFGSG